MSTMAIMVYIVIMVNIVIMIITSMGMSSRKAIPSLWHSIRQPESHHLHLHHDPDDDLQPHQSSSPSSSSSWWSWSTTAPVELHGELRMAKKCLAVEGPWQRIAPARYFQFHFYPVTFSLSLSASTYFKANQPHFPKDVAQNIDKNSRSSCRVASDHV